MIAALLESGGLPSRSEIADWPTAHLEDVAAQLHSMGGQSVTLFERHRRNIATPGGTTWEGDAKDAALDRVSADIAVVRRQSAVQDEAAGIAENGGHDVRSAKRAALEAIAEAEADGFRVGEDLSVTDTRKVSLDTMAARRTAATEQAEDIRWNTEQLVQTDSLIGQRLQRKAVELEAIRFDGESDGQGLDGENTVQLVDNDVARDPQDEPGGEPDVAAGQAPGQIGPFPVPQSVADAATKPEANSYGDVTDASGIGGTLEDLLNPDEAVPGEPGDGQTAGLPPALSQRSPPSALDQILNQHAGKGDGQDGRYTKSPLTAPIVTADPSVLDRQAARIDGARQALDVAQAESDAAAGQGYSHGAGAGPGRDVTDPLGQAVFDARRELTEQTAILADLSQAATETGVVPVPIPALPDNADVQAFPPEPPVVERATTALAEGTKNAADTVWDLTMPDVGNMYDVATNWDEASGADKTQAVLDTAGMVPLPGAKVLGEGIEHGLDIFGGASRHLDDVAQQDIPAAVVDTPTPPGTIEHPTPAPLGDTPRYHDNPAPVPDAPPPPLPPDSPLFDGYSATSPGPEFTNPDGGLIYPDDSLPNKPYAVPGTVIDDAQIPQGTVIDRFGYPGGAYLSPEGVPYAERALPPDNFAKPYYQYAVNDPSNLPPGWRIEQSQAAPWFHQPGGGIQYRIIAPDGVRASTQTLVDWGFLREVR